MLAVCRTSGKSWAPGETARIERTYRGLGSGCRRRQKDDAQAPPASTATFVLIVPLSVTTASITRLRTRRNPGPQSSSERHARRPAVYLSLDFQPEKTVYQRQGTVRQAGVAMDRPPTGVVRQLQDKDLPAVIASDALAFGVSRQAVIGALFAHSSGYGLFREDKLCAFALCRRFGRGHVVGPVVAANDEDTVNRGGQAPRSGA